MRHALGSARERGASIVEYALAIALIAVVSLSAITLVGNETQEEFDCLAIELGAPEIRHKVLEKLRNDVKAFTIVEANFRDNCL